MPYENSGIIKVPERIARSSACIAVLYLQVCTEVGHKTYCSTVRGLIYTRVTGKAQCHNYRCGRGGGEGSHAPGGEEGSSKASTVEYNKDEEDTKQNTAK